MLRMMRKWDRYLTELALTNAELYLNDTTEPLKDTALAILVDEYQTVKAVISRLSSHYHPAFLNQLIYQLAIPDLSDVGISAWLSKVEQGLSENLPTGTSYTLSIAKKDSDSALYIKVSFNRHGISTDFHIPSEFFASTEYQRILDFANKINGLFSSGSRVQRGERSEEISNFCDAVAWLLKEAYRGQNVQRYKGLGEMNPGQLWETTMDASKRRLLQVKIEDAIAADETFNTLMGDNVEPRREFIEMNALQATNLDI